MFYEAGFEPVFLGMHFTADYTPSSSSGHNGKPQAASTHSVLQLSVRVVAGSRHITHHIKLHHNIHNAQHNKYTP